MRPPLLLALVLAFVWVPAGAEAAAPTCQGQPATLVGKPGKELTGTSGADVVVTRGASRVSTGAGDDLVCVADSPEYRKRLMLDTAAGNDGVVVEGEHGVRAFLGDGDDRYAGGAGVDTVWAGYPDSYDYGHMDDGTDTIRTGDGDDDVRAATNDDVLALGRGDDSLIWEAGSGEADGGPGRNSVLLYGRSPSGEEPGTWVLDNRTGTLSRDGDVLFSLEGFTGIRVGADGPLTIRGSKKDESFLALAYPVTVRAGGGDDQVLVRATEDQVEFAVTSIDGGAGRDEVQVEGYRGSGEAWFDLDLSKERYRFQIDDVQQAVALSGIEDAEVSGFPQVSMRGDSSRNRFSAHVVQDEGRTYENCRVLVSGRGGDDRLTLLSGPLRPTTEDCPAPRVQGGGGNDLMIGSREDEQLLGGPGRDTARGGPGTDVCVAEARVSCEQS